MINTKFIMENTTEAWRKLNYDKPIEEVIVPTVPNPTSETVAVLGSNEKLPIIGECSICVEEMTKNDVIECKMCKNSSCKNCFKRFILDHELESKCMHCKVKISREFIIRMLDVTWLKNDYREFRQKHLFNVEKSKFPETNPAARAYMTAKEIITRLPFDPVTGEYKGNIHNFNKYANQFNTFNDATLCIIDYGRGFEEHDFESGLKNKPKSIKKTIKCPFSNCAGIIPLTGDDELICAMCYGTVCSKCQEQTNQSKHMCNEDTVKTINDLRENTRSCPVCSALIFKIEGCDQMFCTQCHTTFSWNTARIERGFQHNPHYLDWVREQRMKRIAAGELDLINAADAAGGGGGAVAAAANEIPQSCLEYITYEKLITCFTYEIWKESFEARKRIPKIANLYDGLPSKEFYCLAIRNLHSNILEVRSTAGNHANMVVPDNHSLRVRFLTNNIEETEFKDEIEKREYEWHENITKFYIYDMVFRSTGDIFDNMLHRKNTGKYKDLYHNIFIELLNILEYGNDCLEEHDRVYNSKSRKFKRRPF